MVATANASCKDVQAEIVARIAGQSTGAWHDPHNNGTYTLVSQSTGRLDTSRVTGNKKYTDKQTFTFQTSGCGEPRFRLLSYTRVMLFDVRSSSCIVSGCSESQVTSVYDASTNYCDLRMLYCSQEQGCHPVTSSFAVQETQLTPSFGAGKDASACLTV